MDINDLHSALANLAATTPDEPGLLSAVHRDVRRSHRRRTALVGGSALVVTGAAVAVAAGGFPATGHPVLPASAGPTTTTVKSAEASLQPALCEGGGAASAPAVAVPAIVSWTGSPPAIGQTFEVTGRVTAATGHTVTVALNGGDAGGTVTLTTQSASTAPVPTGATVQLGGTRTGRHAYEVTSMGITSGGVGMGFSSGSASSAAGGAAASAGAAPPVVCVGQGASLRSGTPAP
jgi:hypothetical protein